MSLRESLEELLNVEERLHILELENKAMRIQNDMQSQMIAGLSEELRLLRRFKQLIERSAFLVDSMTNKTNVPSQKNME